MGHALGKLDEMNIFFSRQCLKTVPAEKPRFLGRIRASPPHTCLLVGRATAERGNRSESVYGLLLPCFGVVRTLRRPQQQALIIEVNCPPPIHDW